MTKRISASIHTLQAIRREKRGQKLYEYIKKHYGETAYSLAKKLKWPLTSVQELVDELIASGFLRIEEITEDGRLKKKLYPLKLKDATYTDFNEEELSDPLIKNIVNRAQEKGFSIYIHRKDGTVIELKPNSNL